MKIIKKVSEMQQYSDSLRNEGRTIAVVPTMGALHDAHLSLIKKARKENDIVIVTIFVNPTQFGPNEDFELYPRMLEEDINKCKNEKTDCVFAPDTGEMYKDGNMTEVSISDITETMCGAARKGHFNGVATIVTKLFNSTKPDCAYFGQKDYQQFKVIEKLVSDLNFDIKLVMCPIYRERNGLAMSSRNKYLSEKQFEQASNIYISLCRAAEALVKKEAEIDEINAKIEADIKERIEGSKIDYFGIFDAQSLKNLESYNGDALIAAAVWVGKARLIDNILIKNGKYN